MWKEYSKGYLKQNRSAGVSVMAAALLAAFFLSLLCSLFYNFWAYDVERILLEEGCSRTLMQTLISPCEIPCFRIVSI